MPDSQLQHYVPRFLLRRFGVGKKKRLHVFDKHTGRRFASAARNLAAERSLYDFEFRGTKLTLEPGLAELESRAARHIERIVKDKRLHVMEHEERGELARFLAVQMIRTKASVAMTRDVYARMEKWLRKSGADDKFFEPDPALGSRENAERAMFAREIAEAPKDLGPALVAKDWVLLQNDGKKSYLIGDNPLTMHNMIRREGRGNLGLAVEGIEVYFPLSPDLALALWCPSHREALVNGYQRIAQSSKTQPWLGEQFSDVSKNVVDIMNAITKGVPLRSQAENVVFFNSLQVAFAERFVFGSNEDFSLVEEMIRIHPELRHGRRLSEGTGKF